MEKSDARALLFKEQEAVDGSRDLGSCRSLFCERSRSKVDLGAEDDEGLDIEAEEVFQFLSLYS